MLYQQERLGIAREFGDRQSEASALGCIGLTYVRMRQFDEAISHHELHLQIAKEIGNRRGEAAALGHIGVAYEHMGALE
jgi:hypothetical protein